MFNVNKIIAPIKFGRVHYGMEHNDITETLINIIDSKALNLLKVNATKVITLADDKVSI